MKGHVCAGIAAVVLAMMAGAGSAQAIPVRCADPYLGYVTVDAATGEVLDESKGDTAGYPASIVKLMDLLLVVESVERGEHKLEEIVQVTAEASRIGGSQVYLKEGETFTLDEMMAALIIKSANDVATAVAIHMAGATGAFVVRMNERAAQLGMTGTRFASVHGLPPDSKDKQVDITTPKDLAKLCCELVKHPLVLQYTSASYRKFRDGKFDLRSHNYLLGKVPGCDGLKTGFFDEAGFSIAATALRENRRVIVVVMGSKSRQTRDQRAAELLEVGFVKLTEVERDRAEKRARELREKAEREAREQAEAAARAKARRRTIIWSSVAGVVVVLLLGVWRAVRLRNPRSKDGFEF